ncbi:hypothetical protein OUZ56_027469 [Daphnia magna]|uniref:Uncharacterized protein n=1 Tax=Daphnia magna TaxID=35525 RepID=A0ABQ9ZPV7_9CRUS|nr:hypothetical protein OUZ56_027469 [Daphnia magna]
MRTSLDRFSCRSKTAVDRDEQWQHFMRGLPQTKEIEPIRFCDLTCTRRLIYFSDPESGSCRPDWSPLPSKTSRAGRSPRSTM